MTSIGGDWISQIDEGSGCPYYTNTVTGETSWDYPAELQEGAAAPSSEGNWIETYDESSGAYYYLHDVTGESTWDKPANYIPVGGAAAESVTTTAADPNSDPANWTSGEDNGNVYYYNSVTGVTQWDMPDALKGSGSEAPVQTPEAVRELPVPPTTKRASFLPPPTIATAVKATPAAPAAPNVTASPVAGGTGAKRASFMPPPSLATGAVAKQPVNPVSAANSDRQAGSEESHTTRPSAAEELDAKPESVVGMQAGLAGPSTAVVEPTATTADSATAASGGEAVSGSEVPPPPRPPIQKKMSKLQSFAALRAMDSVDENESVDFSVGECMSVQWSGNSEARMSMCNLCIAWTGLATDWLLILLLLSSSFSCRAQYYQHVGNGKYGCSQRLHRAQRCGHHSSAE
jgi:hypothetical protein